MPSLYYNVIPVAVLLVFSALFFLSDSAVGQTDGRISADPGQPFFQPSVIDNFSTRINLEELLMEEYIDSETYVLGPGDMFSVDLKGEINQSVRGLVVNGEGNIFIPSMGKVELKDLTLDEARDKINREVDEQFSGTRITLSLDRPRPVMINVHGDVSNPGTYTVPHQTRVDQAIFPAISGESPSFSSRTPYQYNLSEIRDMPYSLRNIRVVSDDGTMRRADLIKYFRTGNKEANPFIREGDVIHIRHTIEEGPKVSISGGVNTSMDMEYRRGDDLQTVLDIAGGFSSDADTTEIRVFRRESSEIVTHTFNPTRDDLSEVTVEANDQVVVPIDRELHQSQQAQISGEVEVPGQYPIVDGETTVYDLLQQSGGVNSRALEHGVYLIRSESGGDRSVKTPRPSAEQLMRTSDQYRQGFEYLELEAALTRNQVHVDLSNEQQLRSTKLYNGDRLIVPKDENTVFMMGQVNNPGHYTFNDQSAEAYIQEAGGYALAAEESRVFVIKAGSRSWRHPDETKLESGDIIYVDRVPFDDLQAIRSYRQGNIQLILTGISTVATVITTYIAVFR